MVNRPAASHLHLKVPKAETALFQHDPAPDAPVKREWEPGCQPDEVYDKFLPPWRAALRRWLVRRLREEKDWMAGWQRRVRSVGRDRYFYWTAVFGTTTFFTIFLPMLFFFGVKYKARGRVRRKEGLNVLLNVISLLHMVGLGIYISSFAKDLVCTPRPYSPPVVRLSMSTHANEYGFPSSHATNAVTIALFFGSWLYEQQERFGTGWMVAGWIFLAFYATSITGGRVYTGMHSIADIVGGAIMGFACWAAWLFVGDYYDAWAESGEMSFPSVMIPLSLALVHYHPEPVDDCPCFEDAIIILSVFLGAGLGHWAESWPATAEYLALSGRSMLDQGPYVGIVLAFVRLVIGIAIVFTWRLIAKMTLLRILPPMFRFSAALFDFELPTRRFYKPATAYSGMPPTPIRPVPSFIHLHNAQEMSIDADTTPEESSESSPVMSSAQDSITGVLRRSPSPMSMRERKKAPSQRTPRTQPNGHGKDGFAVGWPDQAWKAARNTGKRRRIRISLPKYDVEVLTKVGVYSGIGLIASTLVPVLFDRIEGKIFA